MNGSDSSLSLIVKTVARIVARIMLVFGFYIVLHGQITHGGGFAGGVIMALVFVLIMLAYGRDTAVKLLSRSVTIFLAGLGTILLLAIALWGLKEGNFFSNFLGTGKPFEILSGGIIPLCNAAICLVVLGCLYGLFSALATFRPEGEKK